MAQASEEKFEQTGLAESERVAAVPQSEQLARMPELLLPKEKESSVRIVRWERDVTAIDLLVVFLAFYLVVEQKLFSFLNCITGILKIKRNLLIPFFTRLCFNFLNVVVN